MQAGHDGGPVLHPRRYFHNRSLFPTFQGVDLYVYIFKQKVLELSMTRE